VAMDRYFVPQNVFLVGTSIRIFVAGFEKHMYLTSGLPYSGKQVSLLTATLVAISTSCRQNYNILRN